MSEQSETIEYAGYGELLQELKQCISTAKVKASLSVNREMIHLYWTIGKRIMARQEESSWGDKILEVLSSDLRVAFPDVKGFSVRNLKYMRQFAMAYPEIGQQAVAQIPWGHNMMILSKISDSSARQWYAAKTIEHGWSRSVLAIQIENRLYERNGKAITNFETTLPAPQSDLAQQVTRDPYCFDFLTLREDYLEKELEAGLAENVRKTLMALGSGFAFLGNQYPIEVGGNDYFIDLLFFHVKLNCFVVVELKSSQFKPDYTGKLNFYVTAVDRQLRLPEHNRTLGLLLCKDKGHPTVVEYSLADIHKPIGVSTYTTNILDEIPEELQAGLPSREEIAARLDREFVDGFEQVGEAHKE